MYIQIVLITVVIVLVFTIINLKLKKKYNYWKEKGVVYVEPSFLFGNFHDYAMQNEYFGYAVQKLCIMFPDQPFIGVYFGTEPAIIVKDLELIKTVMTKDFNSFNSRDIMDYVHKEVLGKSVLFSNGNNWKMARSILSPMFSTSKMKSMFYLVEKCAYNFEKFIDNLKEYEVRELMSEFTMDTIISCAFGVEFYKMPQNNGFRRIGHMFFNHNIATFAIVVMRFMWPAIFYRLGLSVFPGLIYRFFKKLLQEVFEARNYSASPRHDFVDLLLTAQAHNKVIDDDFMVAQSAAMFLAGYETTATTLAFTLYELSKNPEIQEKVLNEIDEYLKRHGNQLNYDCINELPYLDACVHEALRMYPVLGVITREVSKEYTLPSGLVLERGLRVHIPAYHLQRSEEHFPEPHRFMPERFLPENKDCIKPYSYLPFGEGPRLCIGNRFAKMQAMTGLVTLLKKFKVKFGPKTPKEIIIAPRSISSLARGGLWLKLETRTGWEHRKYVTKGD